MLRRMRKLLMVGAALVAVGCGDPCLTVDGQHVNVNAGSDGVVVVCDPSTGIGSPDPGDPTTNTTRLVLGVFGPCASACGRFDGLRGYVEVIGNSEPDSRALADRITHRCEEPEANACAENVVLDCVPWIEPSDEVSPADFVRLPIRVELDVERIPHDSSDYTPGAAPMWLGTVSIAAELCTATDEVRAWQWPLE